MNEKILLNNKLNSKVHEIREVLVRFCEKMQAISNMFDITENKVLATNLKTILKMAIFEKTEQNLKSSDIDDIIYVYSIFDRQNPLVLFFESLSDNTFADQSTLKALEILVTEHIEVSKFITAFTCVIPLYENFLQYAASNLLNCFANYENSKEKFANCEEIIKCLGILDNTLIEPIQTLPRISLFLKDIREIFTNDSNLNNSEELIILDEIIKKFKNITTEYGVKKPDIMNIGNLFNKQFLVNAEILKQTETTNEESVKQKLKKIDEKVENENRLVTWETQLNKKAVTLSDREKKVRADQTTIFSRIKKIEKAESKLEKTIDAQKIKENELNEKQQYIDQQMENLENKTLLRRNNILTDKANKIFFYNLLKTAEKSTNEKQKEKIESDSLNDISIEVVYDGTAIRINDIAKSDIELFILRYNQMNKEDNLKILKDNNEQVLKNMYLIYDDQNKSLTLKKEVFERLYKFNVIDQICDKFVRDLQTDKDISSKLTTAIDQKHERLIKNLLNMSVSNESKLKDLENFHQTIYNLPKAWEKYSAVACAFIGAVCGAVIAVFIVTVLSGGLSTPLSLGIAAAGGTAGYIAGKAVGVGTGTAVGFTARKVYQRFFSENSSLLVDQFIDASKEEIGISIRSS